MHSANWFVPFKSELEKKAVFTSLPISILLIPFEALIDKDFSCPCKVGLNTVVSLFIFVSPFVFVFALTCFFLQPVKHVDQCSAKKCFSKCPCKRPNLQCLRECVNLKDLFLCLIPPIVWIILVLLDGDYVACLGTNWNGVYISDKELNVKWCKPTELIAGRNETKLQALTLSSIAVSQVS